MKHWHSKALDLIQKNAPLVNRHLNYMERFVAIDSRSFGVNEFEGDRTEPSDMRDILDLASAYLRDIGFQNIIINEVPPGPERATPILMAQLRAGDHRPTVLMYAHLDKQPYMDDHRFLKWGGVPPTRLHWNDDGTRAYGRGAADDLSGVVGIGMAVDALLQTIGYDPQNPDPARLAQLPCNIKVIFETEEESGSHSLIPQILQNRTFFQDADCVIITDVTNPDTGVPGLTTSLRGVLQVKLHLRKASGENRIDEQTALYKVLASLIHEDHSLAVDAIRKADIPVTDEERAGYALIPTTLEQLRERAGLLPETRLTVAEDKVAVLEAQLRKSFANVRPGHRVSGGVVLGAAGARLTFHTRGLKDRQGFLRALEQEIDHLNPFRLQATLTESPLSDDHWITLDLVVRSANKDPHSGITGGPFPVPELQLARIVDRLIDLQGEVNLPDPERFFEPNGVIDQITVQALNTGLEEGPRLFGDPTARAVVEIRLAPGNKESDALRYLKQHLERQVPTGFSLEFEDDKCGPPWMTALNHPAFPLMMECLQTGYSRTPCIYGCGGSIPFVPKLMEALGEIPPMVIGAYDPDCRMHEPGESLSLADLLGCARSVALFLLSAKQAIH